MDNYPPMKTLKVDLTLGAFLKKAPQNSIIQKLYMHAYLYVNMHKGISVSSPQNLKDSKSWETNYLKQVAKKIKAPIYKPISQKGKPLNYIHFSPSVSPYSQGSTQSTAHKHESTKHGTIHHTKTPPT